MASPSGDSTVPKAFGYPAPREGPHIPYKNEAGSNPILRGWMLAAVASVISSSTFIQGIFWKLNGFDKLKEIEILKDGYEPRYDPTVTPVDAAASELMKTPQDLPQPRARKNALSYYTCADYHAAYKSGQLTPSDVIELLLPLIRRDTTPPGIHSKAFLDSKVDIIRAAAKAATQRYKDGKPLSVLDGVPISVKDEVDLAGYKRTLGSKLDFTNPLDQTAWCVKKWEEAGAVICGKTNMHECGLDTTNNNPYTGTPLNPHDSDYYTGGSSGGSAYTVAAGICPISLGADGGGSIRLPASFCGVYGLKTSHGRVSGRPTNDLGYSVGVYGPLASSIDDLALAYRVMAQPDPEHRASSMFSDPMTAFSYDVRSPKVLGICDEWINRSDPEVKQMFLDAVQHYERTGYEIVHINIPLLPQGQKAHAMTILSEIRSGFTQAQISKLTYHNQLLLNVAGSHASCQDFLFAQRLRDLLMRHLSHLFQKYPGLIIVTPTTPCAGWKIGSPKDIVVGSYGVSDGDMSLKSMEYVYLANFTGNPALSCPMGYVGSVPVGLMGMSNWGCEEQLLHWGKDGENLLGEEGVRRPSTNGTWVDTLPMVKSLESSL